MPQDLPLQMIEPVARPSIADQVFEALHARVLTLHLPPGAKLSEAEVARQLNVSRQPVRDAFYRLSQLGFLVIQPQRATTVSQISARDVFRARFVRTALEVEIARLAASGLTPAHHDALGSLLDDQHAALAAGDHALFHRLDNRFHRLICDQVDRGFAWATIAENKAHTDRVRYLSLAFASQDAWNDHRAILDAFRARDTARAVEAVRLHLSRIDGIVARLRAENHSWFAEED